MGINPRSLKLSWCCICIYANEKRKNMRDKKIILIILSILAVISWIYGLGISPKTKLPTMVRQVEKNFEEQIFVAKRSKKASMHRGAETPLF